MPHHPNCAPDNLNAPDHGYFENIKIESIGGDLFCGSWGKDQGFFDQITYYQE